MAKSILEIDKNLKSIKLNDGLSFYDVRATNARIYGLAEYGERFCRLPMHLHSLMSADLRYLQSNTSGARVRFIVYTKRLGIKLLVNNTDGFPHMPYSGYAGIDCFAGEGKTEKWLGSRWPELGKNSISTEFELSDGANLITLYLPLYSGITQLFIGVEPGTQLSAPPDYKYEQPIVFYGSSITQGGCASRASNSYPAIVCRQMQSDFINLGFSGNAKGESWMAEYIANLQMRAFIYDYDHNAPDIEHLQSTHLSFLKKILEKQPNIPIIFMSKPYPNLNGDDYQRRQIIKRTYEYAVKNGAKSAFIDGNKILGTIGKECCTVDGIHPNDLGFWRMAKAVSRMLNVLLK